MPRAHPVPGKILLMLPGHMFNLIDHHAQMVRATGSLDTGPLRNFRTGSRPSACCRRRQAPWRRLWRRHRPRENVAGCQRRRPRIDPNGRGHGGPMFNAHATAGERQTMTSTLSQLIFYNKRITTLNLQTSPATPWRSSSGCSRQWTRIGM